MKIQDHTKESKQEFINNDAYTTLITWLNSYEPSKSTFLAYKSVVNKILMFLQTRNIQFNALNDDDGKTLLDWVEASFQLKASSMRHFYSVANKIFDMMQTSHHISINPLRLHKNTLKYRNTKSQAFENTDNEITTYLDVETWMWFWEWLCTRPALRKMDTKRHARDRFFMALLYHTGIRREEVTKLKMSHVVYRNNRWRLLVHGKGGKTRMVSMNSTLVSELFRYRESIGLNAQPSVSETDMPIIVRLKGTSKRQLSVRGITYIVHEIKESLLAEENFYPGEHIINQIEAMTTHWMRHTNATHRLMAGASLETTQDELGHVSPLTTRIYTHTLEEKRAEDAEKLTQLGKIKT